MRKAILIMCAVDVEQSGESAGIETKDINMKVYLPKLHNNLHCPYCGRWILLNAARRGYMKKYGYFRYNCEQCGRYWVIQHNSEGYSYILEE